VAQISFFENLGLEVVFPWLFLSSLSSLIRHESQVHKPDLGHPAKNGSKDPPLQLSATARASGRGVRREFAGDEEVQRVDFSLRDRQKPCPSIGDPWKQAVHTANLAGKALRMLPLHFPKQPAAGPRKG